MKKLLLSIVMLLTLGMSFHGVAAQELAPSDAGVDVKDIEGLQSAYSRSYSVDMDALMASPSAEGIDLSAMMTGVQIMGFTFDGDDNAKNFMKDGKSEIEKSLKEEVEGVEVKTEDVKDLGDEAYRITMDMSSEGFSLVIDMVIVRDGNTVFTVMSMGGEADAAKSQADAVAKYVVDAESQTDEVTFNEDGTSTGGVFDRMPKEGDEVIGQLVIESDMDLLAAESGN